MRGYESIRAFVSSGGSTMLRIPMRGYEITLYPPEQQKSGYESPCGVMSTHSRNLGIWPSQVTNPHAGL